MLGKPNPTVEDICAAYIKAKKDPHAFKKCLHPDNIESSLKRVRAEWGTLTIDEFNKGTLRRVEEAYSKWCSAGTQTGTSRKALSLFRAACNHASKRELIRREQVPLFDLPPPGPPRERVVDPDKELPDILHEAKNGKTPYHIWLQTELLLRIGCRVGALLKLQWSKHIDFEKRVIRLRDTQSADERRDNKKRREDAPMDEDLYRLLLAARERAQSDFVIEWRGKGVSRTYAGQKALYKRAGVENLHRHDLRRTSATYVRDSLSLEKAAEHIGDTIEMTRKHYAHANPERKLEGIQNVGALLRKAAS